MGHAVHSARRCTILRCSSYLCSAAGQFMELVMENKRSTIRAVPAWKQKLKMKSHACSRKSVRFLLHARGVNQEVGKRRRTNFGALDLRTLSRLCRAGNEARRVELCALNLAVALYSCRSISIDLHGYITEHTRLPKMQLKHAVVICHAMMLCHMWKIME